MVVCLPRLLRIVLHKLHKNQFRDPIFSDWILRITRIPIFRTPEFKFSYD